MPGERIGRPFEGERHRDGGELGEQQQHQGADDAQPQVGAVGRPDVGPEPRHVVDERTPALGFRRRSRRGVVDVHAVDMTRRARSADGRRIPSYRPNRRRIHHVRRHFSTFCRGLHGPPRPLDARGPDLPHALHGSDSQGLRLLRFERRNRPGLRRGGDPARRDPRRGGHRARLWRRLGRADGRARQGDAGARRRDRRRDPGIPRREGAPVSRRQRDRGHARHARPQADDVRAIGRLRGAAGRHRHPGGAGRAADLGAARPPPQADPDRQPQRILGRPARPVRAHGAAPATSIRPPGSTSSSSTMSRRSCRRCGGRRRRCPRKRRRASRRRSSGCRMAAYCFAAACPFNTPAISCSMRRATGAR